MSRGHNHDSLTECLEGCPEYLSKEEEETIRDDIESVFGRSTLMRAYSRKVSEKLKKK